MVISGSTILVTGGNSGIGRALAEALHAAGARVIITGRNRATLEETAAANPGMAHHVLDVADAGAVRDFAARVVVDHPELDVVIHNAGIMQAEDMTADAIDLSAAETTVATNLLGPIRLSAALLPHLRGRPKATLMTVTSGLAFVPLAGTPTYSATKAALHSWSVSLRHQLRGTAVEVVELAPPLVATDLTPGQRDDPQALPLADFTREVMDLLNTRPDAPEVLVERVKPLRTAEASGRFDQVFAMVNPS